MQLKWRLSHARGYLELGLVNEAAQELARISADERDRLEVLVLRIAIFQEKKKWRALRRAAAELVRRKPEEPSGWITWAYATRRSASLEAAEEILLKAVRLHDREATIHFNLACYACQRGDLPAARERLTRACALDGDFISLARVDPDLAPLRDPPSSPG